MDPALTQTTDAERRTLLSHASRRLCLIELGVYEGSTTALLARAMAEEGVLYAIDPFPGGRLGISWCKKIAYAEVRKIRPQPKVVFLEKLSFEAAPQFGASVDFIFFDGDHSLEGISRDWSDWSGKILPCGIAALHDTRVPKHNPRVAELGSCRFFNEHIRHDSRFELVDQIDSLSVLRRK